MYALLDLALALTLIAIPIPITNPNPNPNPSRNPNLAPQPRQRRREASNPNPKPNPNPNPNPHPNQALRALSLPDCVGLLGRLVQLLGLCHEQLARGLAAAAREAQAERGARAGERVEPREAERLSGQG